MVIEQVIYTLIHLLVHMLMKEEGDTELFGHFFASHPDTQTRIQDLNHKAHQAGYSQQMPLPLPKLLNPS